MFGYIGSIDYSEMENMKYWAAPATWSQEKKKTTIYNRVYSGEWLGARKVDGAFYKLIKDDDGNIMLLGRSRGVNGQFLDKHEWLPQLNEFYNALPNGTCLLGEVYLPNKEGSKNTTTIMGCLKEKAIERQKNEPAHYYVFDVLAWNGESYISMAAARRFKALEYIRPMIKNDVVEIADYYRGDKLWEMLQILLANGYEGMVITHEDAVYEPGKRPSKTTAKIKQEIKETIDVVIIGYNPPTRVYTGKNIETWKYWVDLRTGDRLEPAERYKDYKLGAAIEPVTLNFYNGWAGSLKIGLYKDGDLQHYGDLSGLTQEVLANCEDYIDRVAEIGGMQFDNKSGHIRHPKFLGWRNDKEPHDCTFSQIK